MSNTKNHYFTVRVETQNDRRCAELDLLCAFASRFPDSSKFHLEGGGIKTKPDPQKVPLGPGDVLPGTAVKGPRADPGSWALALQCNNGGIYIRTSKDLISFQNMMDQGWQIKRPGEDWKPCWKEVKV